MGPADGCVPPLLLLEVLEALEGPGGPEDLQLDASLHSSVLAGGATVSGVTLQLRKLSAAAIDGG